MVNMEADNFRRLSGPFDGVGKLNCVDDLLQFKPVNWP